ncbi:MAG: hypothetical protein JWM47_4365 [Acidimicrobiales bacterium]|nr:hypothetical protein [Acidimicrobiales bacterium]
MCVFKVLLELRGKRRWRRWRRLSLSWSRIASVVGGGLWWCWFRVGVGIVVGTVVTTDWCSYCNPIPRCLPDWKLFRSFLRLLLLLLLLSRLVSTIAIPLPIPVQIAVPITKRMSEKQRFRIPRNSKFLSLDVAKYPLLEIPYFLSSSLNSSVVGIDRDRLSVLLFPFRFPLLAFRIQTCTGNC